MTFATRGRHRNEGLPFERRQAFGVILTLNSIASRAITLDPMTATH
jgi:hypothetical protein